MGLFSQIAPIGNDLQVVTYTTKNELVSYRLSESLKSVEQE